MSFNKQIGLPPLIEDEKRRQLVSRTVKNTRERFREFRSKLSQEIRQSNVLPGDLQSRMMNELDKRLELDVDELLSSPKLKLQLSPAELDRQLLDLYNSFTDSPSCDIFRLAMGGVSVGRQSYYLKQQALKAKAEARKESGEGKAAVPQFLEDVGVDEYGTATKWIKRTLRRNLQPATSQTFLPAKKLSQNHNTNISRNDNDSTPMMSLIRSHYPKRTTNHCSFPNQKCSTGRLSSRLPSLLI